ncbi:MAG: shikimate dehydrogenase [Verrucomicrobia bacterium]|nr:shikimate dehydrogenase [Verrucomicrobiota bacterium]
MNLDGHTQPFAVLGHPIGHTLSPVMHNAAFRALKMNAIYLAFDVAPDNLMGVLPAMARMGFRGINLTVPLKEVAFKGLTDLDDSARDLGAVNTVQILPAGLRGHNTDGRGFILAIKEAFGTSLKGLNVFILGSGGAGRAVAITCATGRAASIQISDMDYPRAGRVVSEIKSRGGRARVSAIEPGSDALIEACRNADLVINATTVGMKKNDRPPLPVAAFGKNQIAFDLVYMYPRTSFMKVAQKAGAKAVNGLGMLLHQGAHAFSIWTGREPAVKDMRRALESAVYRRG